eukprot:TRINITY_DN90587_c0_g1_i1.p1 TRINITY_DN90587_c0_g1~~TRINITY_DN90587_c0_g1_i1.p1  ORF type:complete len:477 (-),score=65.37 TRINITY_DN90587_c0_g1_i1:644-2074(-)
MMDSLILISSACVLVVAVFLAQSGDSLVWLPTSAAVLWVAGSGLYTLQRRGSGTTGCDQKPTLSGAAQYHPVGYQSLGSQVVKYNDLLLSRFDVMGIFRNTVLADTGLWSETLLLLSFGCIVAAAVDAWRTPENGKAIEYIASRLEPFAKHIWGFNTFFLGAYTSTSVARWWRLRTEGVGAMWASAAKLSTLLASELVATLQDDERSAKPSTLCEDASERQPKRQRVTDLPMSPQIGSKIGEQDASRLVNHVVRYACISLRLVFAQKGRGASLPVSLEELNALGHLEAGEAELLLKVGSNLPEAIWGWILALLLKLYKARLIGQKDGVPWWQYVEYWQSGRGGTALIGAQMGTQLPFAYVHFMAAFVKLSNMVLVLSMGLVMSCSFHHGGKDIDAVIALGSAFLLPLISNAVLLLNVGLANPFGVDGTAFPEFKYVEGFADDCRAYVAACTNLPAWSRECWADASSGKLLEEVRPS